MPAFALLKKCTLSLISCVVVGMHVGGVIGIIVGRGGPVREARHELRGLTDVVIGGFIRTDVCGGIVHWQWGRMMRR